MQLLKARHLIADALANCNTKGLTTGKRRGVADLFL
jgi:hypothetical protein